MEEGRFWPNFIIIFLGQLRIINLYITQVISISIFHYYYHNIISLVILITTVALNSWVRLL